MKCLSVSQPFANLIVSGKKTIELRGWNTKFRGEFLIHAPQKVRKADCKRLRIPESQLVIGAIIGKATLYDVKIYESTINVKKDQKRHHSASYEFFDKCKYGFMLKDNKAFRVPLPCKGRLGLFDVNLSKIMNSPNNALADIIEQEHCYRLIGHH